MRLFGPAGLKLLFELLNSQVLEKNGVLVGLGGVPGPGELFFLLSPFFFKLFDFIFLVLELKS